MLNLNSVDKFLNQVYRSFTVGDLVTIEAFSHRNLIVLSGIEHEYILNISIDDFSVYKAEPSKMITGVTPHLDLEVEVELIRCEDGFVVCIKDEKGDISYHRCIPEWKDHQAYVIRSNKLRNNLPVLKIKERPNGDAEFIHSDFMIKLPIKFSRILDNLDYSTLGNVGSRYNPDGSQDNVYVVIHYNPDTGHSVTIADSNSKRHYSLEKEEFPEGTVRQVSEDMFVLSTNGPIFNLYTDLYFSGNIVKEIRQHKGKDGTIIFLESLFRYPSGRTHEPYELTVIFRESGDHFGILTDRAKGSVSGRFRLVLDLQEQLEKVEPSDKPINVTLEIAKKEDNMFGLPKIEDVRKKTDEALEISIAKIGSAITEASTLGESSVLISKGGFPDSSLRRIMEEISKTGYMVSHISSGELVIAW